MDGLAVVLARRDVEIERVFLGIAAIRHRGSNQVSYRIDLIPGGEHALWIGEGPAQPEQRVADLLLARLIPIGHFEAPRTARLLDLDRILQSMDPLHVFWVVLIGQDVDSSLEIVGAV